MARWLGLDITTAAVRVALIRSSYRTSTVEALREERIADHETASAAIRAAVFGLRFDAVATVLGGERAFVRRIRLPSAAQKRLSDVLSFEVEATLPFEPDDAVMDHRLLTFVKGIDEEGQIPIFSGVAYTEEVRDRIGLVLRGSGQEPQRVGVGPLPLANLCSAARELMRPEPIAILELGEEETGVVVLRKGEPRLARTLSRGARSLPAEAEALARELRQTVAAWRMQEGTPIEALYTVGFGHDINGLHAFLGHHLGIPVGALPALALDAEVAGLKEAYPRYARAIGLALGLFRKPVDLNLRQGPLEAQQSYQFLREKTPLLAGLAAAIFVSFGFAIFAELRALDAERGLLEQQLAQATESQLGEKTTDPKRAAELLEDVISGKTGDPIPKMDAFDVMVELSERIPPEVVHDIADFDYNRGDVKMAGIVPAISDANLVKSRMAEQPCFKDVNITRTTQLKNQDKQKYTLEFKVRCDGGSDKDKEKDKSKAKTKTKTKTGASDKETK